MSGPSHGFLGTSLNAPLTQFDGLTDPLNVVLPISIFFTCLIPLGMCDHTPRYRMGHTTLRGPRDPHSYGV